jgi:hypothetical protein
MKIASGVFHPLLMATYLCSILLVYAPELFPTIKNEFRLTFVSLIFLLTCLLPGLSIMLLKTFSLVTDLELSSRKERFYPFFLIIIFYGSTCYLFIEVFQIGRLMSIMMIGVTVLITVMLIITSWFKVSIHSAAIWSSIGFLSAATLILGINLGWFYYFAIIAAGLTSTSRLYLGYHSPQETWIGIFLGFFYSFFLIVFSY